MLSSFQNTTHTYLLSTLRQHIRCAGATFEFSNGGTTAQCAIPGTAAILRPLHQVQHRALAPASQGDILSLPVELRYLIPPAPPSDGKYTAFGNTIDPHAAERSLAERDIEQLYPSNTSSRLNPQPHLTALTRSMLTTFLALSGILSQNPELYEEKVKDLHTIAMNIHELINQYRPHQARETLIMMMEERVDKMKKESHDVDKAKEKVAKLLQDIHDMQRTYAPPDGGQREGGSAIQEASVARRKARQRAVWAALRQVVV